MQVYLIRRLIALLATLFIVSIIIFIVLNVIPGDPAQIILGIEADPAALETVREKLGLNRPLMVRYVDWLKGVLTGNFGHSIHYDMPISELITSRLPVTVPLAALAILFAIIIAVPLGIYAATHLHSIRDYSSMILSQLGIAIPSFWTGILFIILFSVHLHWLPAGGFVSWSEDPIAAFKSLLLPALSLSIIEAAIITRMTRSSLLEVLREDYIQTARSKGLTERIVIYKHALRNASLPILTVLGLRIGMLLAGSIIIENVFYLPGLGRLVLLAIFQRDLPVVQAIVLLIAAVIVLVNFLVDILYGFLDPRIIYES